MKETTQWVVKGGWMCTKWLQELGQLMHIFESWIQPSMAIATTSSKSLYKLIEFNGITCKEGVPKREDNVRWANP